MRPPAASAVLHGASGRTPVFRRAMARSYRSRIAFSTTAAASISRQRAARRALASSSTPQRSFWKSSSTWAARQAVGRRRKPRATASASSAEPVRVVITLSARAPPDRRRPRAPRAPRPAPPAADRHASSAGREHEARAERFGRPVEDRIESLPLALGERLRGVRAVAERGPSRRSGRCRPASRPSCCATPSIAELRSSCDRHVGGIERLALPPPIPPRPAA